MKKIKYILPLIAVFLSPWIHKLAFENLKLAINMSDNTAHGFALFSCVTASIVSIFFAMD